jgi:hypothetical protein
MTDIAALAEALHFGDPAGPPSHRGEPAEECPQRLREMERAAAILAALPPDWCGHKNSRERDELARQQNVEIARLRKIEEAARALCDEWPWGAQHIAPPTALRAALEADRP